MKLLIIIFIILLGNCSLLGDGSVRGERAVSILKSCLMIKDVSKVQIIELKKNSLFTTIIDIKLKGKTHDIAELIVNSQAINNTNTLSKEIVINNIGSTIEDQWIDGGDLVSCNYTIINEGNDSCGLTISLVYESLKTTSVEKNVKTLKR
jgi:hypothetical protein